MPLVGGKVAYGGVGPGRLSRRIVSGVPSGVTSAGRTATLSFRRLPLRLLRVAGLACGLAIGVFVRAPEGDRNDVVEYCRSA